MDSFSLYNTLAPYFGASKLNTKTKTQPKKKTNYQDFSSYNALTNYLLPAPANSAKKVKSISQNNKLIPTIKPKSKPRTAPLPVGVNQISTANKVYNVASLTPEQVQAQYLTDLLSNVDYAQKQNMYNYIPKDRQVMQDVYNSEPQTNINMDTINKQVSALLPKDYAPLAKSVLTLNLIKDAMQRNSNANLYNTNKYNTVLRGLLGTEQNLNGSMRVPLTSSSKKSNPAKNISDLIAAATKLRNPNTGQIDKSLAPFLSIIYQTLGMKPPAGWSKKPYSKADLEKINKGLK